MTRVGDIVRRFLKLWDKGIDFVFIFAGWLLVGRLGFEVQLARDLSDVWL